MGDDDHARGLLRALIEGCTDAVFVKDRSGRYVLCNVWAARLVGRPAAEIVGRTDAELFAPPEAAAFLAVDNRIMETGAPETFEERFVSAGEARTMQTTKFPYRSDDGEIVGVVGIARDITDRRSAEDTVRQNERLLRLVLGALPVGVLVVDPDGDIVLGNPTAQRIWGRSIDQGTERWAKSRGWWHHSGAQVQPDEWASVRALVEGVPQLDQLIDIEAFDGVRRTIRNSAVPMTDVTGVQGAVVLNEDVTERLQLEARLAQVQKLEAVGRLAGGVAHDFNNLLMVITSCAEAVGETLAGDDPRRLEIAEIAKAADSAAALTRQLLAFGRREVPQLRAVILEEAIASAGTMLTRVIGEHIQVELRLAGAVNVVRIDPVHVEQIVLNLAVNARDAMPAGGTLTIATRTIEHTPAAAAALGLRGAGPFAVLAVTDTGAGMDARTQARIFEPFFTTKPRGQGTGLGLATVYGIVKQNGGAIRVATAPGRGTTFEIELPIHALRAGDAPEASGEDRVALRGSEHLLLVEDAAPVRVVVRAMLEKLGYTVHDVADATAALAHVALAATRVDLLITDVVLGGMNGRMLAEAVEARRPGTRVLYISGHADDELLRHVPDAQRARILAKPFSADQLGRAVRDILDGKQR